MCCVLGKFNGFWGIFLQLFRFVVHFVVVAVPFLLLLLLLPLLLLLLWLCVSKFMFAGYENEMTVVNILIKSKFGFCLRYNNIFCCRCCHSVSLSPPPSSSPLFTGHSLPLSPAAIFYFILHFLFFCFLLLQQQINCNFILPRFNLLSTFCILRLCFIFIFICSVFSFAFTLYACALLFCLLASSFAHAGVGE